MTTKKQRAELESALTEWLFEGIADEWTTTELLEAAAKDWDRVVGAYTPAALRGLVEWQGTVLGLVGVGTGREAADKQRQADAGLILWSTADMPEHSVVRALVQELAAEMLAGVSVRRGNDVHSVTPVVVGGTFNGDDTLAITIPSL